MSAHAKSPEEFAAEVAQVAPTVELLGPYVNARTKVACRCRGCGHEWEASPNHLLRGVGCPICAGTARVSAEEFAARAAESAPKVEILTPYVNARTRIDCRCRECGNTWSPYPKSLLQGYGCPTCGKRASAQRLADLRDKSAPRAERGE